MTEAQLLDGDAFNRLVLENDLAGKTWEQDGYIYAGMKGVAGWELYRTYGPKWRMLYQARRVTTQNGAGGGALITRITIASGFEATLINLAAIGPASAGATLTITKRDEDNAVVAYLAAVAAGASREMYLPIVGPATAAHQGIINSTGLMIGPGEILHVSSSAALQTETQTVAVVLLLPINATTATVTWDNTGAAGTPAMAASTISAANTLQAVLIP